MRTGTDGTADCTDKCAFIPFLNVAYTCGSCGPIEIQPQSESSYDITFDLIDSTFALSSTDRLEFPKAAGRWEKIITAGLSDIPATALTNGPRFTGCQYPTVVDDVYICTRVAKDDGVGRVLGYSSPSYRRSDDGTSVAGYINLDIDDVKNLINAGTFYDVLSHEIGHILGIGTYFVGTNDRYCYLYMD
jgi:hypothetical protein